MVNDASRRSHDFKDELGGKPEWLGVYCERALKLHPSGKAFRGKPRSKPESGNPTFRDCRGPRGNVTLSAITGCARLGSIPTRSRHSTRKAVLGATTPGSFGLSNYVRFADQQGKMRSLATGPGFTVASVASESINQHFKSHAENFCRW